MIGQTISERYYIEKEIGHGAFGTVFRARDSRLPRLVAIKVLDRAGTSPELQTRFLREAEALARLNHPNIVTIYDTGTIDAHPYLVMEFVDGPSLLTLASRATLLLSEVCHLAAQVCQAMAYAHAHGMIHRDLTLRNIMVSQGDQREPRIKVLDFGLVKMLHGESTSSGDAIRGTPYYVAPEQIRGEAIDARADIYSFGVCLYRLLSGKFPFEAEHPHALLYMIAHDPAPPCPESIPKDFEAIALQCLEKDPCRRPQTFAEISTRLMALQTGTRLDAESSSTSFQNMGRFVERGSRRNPYLNRVMIRNPRDFFGRQREIGRVYARLDAAHPQSISVVGDRRIGKSSLLHYLYLRRNRKRYMTNYEKAVFVYLDLQRDIVRDADGFVDFLFSAFDYEGAEVKVDAGGRHDLDHLRALVQELHKEERRLIVLMDEFEMITGNDNFDASFFSFLRALANAYHVAYVTSSCDELQLMCHNKDIADSPFFNIFSNLPLRAFTREEALDLIRIPSAAEGIPLDSYADRIIELAGYLPLYLQMACCAVFENLLDGDRTSPDWEHVVRAYLDEAHPHYTALWEGLGEPERITMTRAAEGHGISKKFRFIGERLERRGLLFEDRGAWRHSSEAMRDFVLEQARGRQGGGGLLAAVMGRIRGKRDRRS